jgi:hypothetical protein
MLSSHRFQAPQPLAGGGNRRSRLASSQRSYGVGAALQGPSPSYAPRPPTQQRHAARPPHRRCLAAAAAAAATDHHHGTDGWTLLTADAPDFWPLADLHCEVFFPQQRPDGWQAGLTKIDRLLALQMNRALENRKAGR